MTSPTASAPLPAPWHRPDWTGPTVETRPENADPTVWPEGAVERVVFTSEALPKYPYPHELPYTEHFGADGWPLHTPASVKPRLDPRMQAELRRWPWTVRPEQWNVRSWLMAGSDYDRFMRWNAQAGLIRSVLPALPAP